jgi:hypothetical protein
VAPVAEPGPHGDARLPKACPPGAAEVAVDELEVELELDPRLLLQPAATRAATPNPMTARNAHVLPRHGGTPVGCKAGPLL